MKRGKATALLLVLALMLTAGTALAQARQQGTQRTNGQTGMSRLLDTERINGMHVYGANGNDIGEIERVLFNPGTGQIELLVMSYGGFLDLGEEFVAVPYQAFSLTGRGLALNVTEEQLNRAPRFNPTQIGYYQPAYITRVYTFWGYPYSDVAWTRYPGWGSGWAEVAQGGRGTDIGGTRQSYYGDDWGETYFGADVPGVVGPDAPAARKGRSRATLTGTIGMSGEDYVLHTDDWIYRLNTDKDLSRLTNRQVEVAGIVSQGIIDVRTIRPTRNGAMGGTTRRQGGQR